MTSAIAGLRLDTSSELPINRDETNKPVTRPFDITHLQPVVFPKFNGSENERVPYNAVSSGTKIVENAKLISEHEQKAQECLEQARRSLDGGDINSARHYARLAKHHAEKAMTAWREIEKYNKNPIYNVALGGTLNEAKNNASHANDISKEADGILQQGVK